MRTDIPKTSPQLLSILGPPFASRSAGGPREADVAPPIHHPLRPRAVGSLAFCCLCFPPMAYFFSMAMSAPSFMFWLPAT